MILWTMSAFTCRILHRLQCVRSCRCLKIFFCQVNVINCLFNVFLVHILRSSTLQYWLDYLSERKKEQNAWMPRACYSWLLELWKNLCARIRAVIKRILQETQHGARSAFIIHVCMSSHTSLKDMWHTGHACMCIHLLYTEINLFFSTSYWPELEDRFMPAWCLPVCDVFTDGA